MNKIFSARVAERWDPYHGKYRPYVLPEDELKCSLLEDRMDKVIACAGCGKPVKFGFDCRDAWHVASLYCLFRARRVG